jgi:outer membrane protein TolC
MFVLVLLAAIPAAACDTSPRALAACVVESHPLILAEREKLSALSGARVSASTLLPSHPELSFSMAERRLWSGGAPVLNFYLSLSQRIEIAGQRATRLVVVDAQARAQLQRTAFTELTVALEGVRAALALVAARERNAHGSTLRVAAERLARIAEERRKSALISSVDASLLVAEASRIAFEADEALLHEQSRSAELKVYTSSEVVFSLDRLPALTDRAWLEHALAARQDLGALSAEADAQLALKTQLERERAPSVTVSAFLQSDGFGERVIGAGLALPLFFPSPLGPSRRGEIDAAGARARELQALADARQREVRAEVERAVFLLRTREHQATLFKDDRSREHVLAVVDALAANQFNVREGLASLRSLIEAMNREIDARYAVYDARLVLARAAALPVDQVLP